MSTEDSNTDIKPKSKSKSAKEPKVKEPKEPKVKEPKVKEPKAKEPKEPKAKESKKKPKQKLNIIDANDDKNEIVEIVENVKVDVAEAEAEAETEEKDDDKPIIEVYNPDLHDELIYCFHITNVHTNCTIQTLHDSLDILRLGEVIQISIHTKYTGPITGKEKDPSSRQSEAYVYYKGSQYLINKNPVLKRMLTRRSEDNKIDLFHLLDGDMWKCRVNTDHFVHFRPDDSVFKHLIVQSIATSRNSSDIHWLFREHGNIEQVDMIWVKSDECPKPIRCQSYVYFKEWGQEEYTYKMLDELNEFGVFTVKYDYNGYHDLLWIYELLPKSETSKEYDFPYGKYKQWLPRDDPKYGNRCDEGNKLNWYFTDEGRFAYSRVVENEIKEHGGLFIGPEKQFFKIEIEQKKPIEFSWTTDGDCDDNEEVQKMQQLILEALQKCLNKN